MYEKAQIPKWRQTDRFNSRSSPQFTLEDTHIKCNFQFGWPPNFSILVCIQGHPYNKSLIAVKLTTNKTRDFAK